MTTGAVPAGLATDVSNTIALGGTAQPLVGGNGARKGLSVLNLSAADLFINEMGTAAATGSSIKIPSGQEYVFAPSFGYVPVSAISIFGATTGQAFAAREW